MIYFLKNCSNKIKKYNKLKWNIKKQIKKKLLNHKHKIKKIINKLNQIFKNLKFKIKMIQVIVNKIQKL